jgi:hypothetical protein
MNALNNEEYVIALPYDMCAEQSAPILSPKGGTSWDVLALISTGSTDAGFASTKPLTVPVAALLVEAATVEAAVTAVVEVEVEATAASRVVSAPIQSLWYDHWQFCLGYGGGRGMHPWTTELLNSLD